MSVTATQDSVLLTLDFSPLKMADKEFYEFCQRNQDFRFEMDKEGNLIVMPPTFLESSHKNLKINVRLGAWAEKDDTGVAIESDGMFTLPNGAKRSPDAFWILNEKYYALSEEEREERFARIVPDFVIELRSKSDNLRKLQSKMREYVENGVWLGWLIDPYERRVHVYRADESIEVLEDPDNVWGEDVLAGFELNLKEIW